MSISDLVSSYETEMKKFQDKLQTALKEEFKKFFDENPDVKFITWLQFTPYFNDGDECRFGVHDFYYDVVEPEELERWGEYPKDESLVSGQVKNNWKKFEKDLWTIPKEIFKQMFGDHVQIIARPSGFDVEEFEHD